MPYGKLFRLPPEVFVREPSDEEVLVAARNQLFGENRRIAERVSPTEITFCRKIGSRLKIEDSEGWNLTFCLSEDEQDLGDCYLPSRNVRFRDLEGRVVNISRIQEEDMNFLTFREIADFPHRYCLRTVDNRGHVTIWLIGITGWEESNQE